MERFNSSKILSYCSSGTVKTILLDFFDTIVSRRVPPEYVKYLSARLFITKSGLSISPKIFYSIRAIIERNLSLENQRKNNALEFNIEDLAENLYNNFKNRLSINLNDFIELFIKCEIQVELSVLYVNNDISELIKAIKASNKGIRIFIVSDFYVPKKYFKEITDQLNLTNLIDELYISTDYGITKRSGRLYEKVLNLKNLSPTETIMIGDSKEADFDMALNNNIKPFFVDNSVKKGFYESMYKNVLSTESLKLNFNTEVHKIISKYKKNVIFPEIPILLYAFTEKLYSVLLKEGFKQVVFCSKEGYFLKKLFDLYQNKYIGETLIDSKYIKVSRRSTYTPSLKILKDEKFEILFRQYKNLSPNQFLKNFHFTQPQREKILSESMIIDGDFIFNEFKETKEFKKIRSSKTFIYHYERLRVEQKKLFEKYLIQEVNSDNFKKLAFVDVGWKGTIQDNIYIFFDKKKDISGKFVGLLLTPESVVSYKNNKEGILFTNNPVSNNLQVYSRMTSLFEILLAAPHGSAKIYKKEKDGIVAVCEDISLEKERYTKEISQLQENHIKIFEEILSLRILDHNLIEFYEDILDVLMSRIQFTPTIEELKFFSNTKHYENFGLFEYTDFSKAEKLSVLKYLKKIIHFVLSFKWIFETSWGVYSFYINDLYILGKVLGMIYFKKFLNKNKK